MVFRRTKLAAALLSSVGVGGAVTLLLSAPVLGQTQEAPPQRIEKIEVTGSSIRRVEGETALPVQTITRDTIQKSGVTTAAELLDKLSLNVGGYNISVGVGDSGQPGFSGVALRGLGSSKTLVLLNGRRIANFAFNGGSVDLNSIPVAAIERVEVLKDGASAIYGTDAIGGVINFIMRKNFTGVDLTGGYSDTDRGGGREKKASVAAGWGNLETNHFNVLGVVDYSKTEALPARLRDFAKTGIRPDLGFEKTSGNTQPANFRWSGGPGTANLTAATGCRPDLGTYRIQTGTGLPSTTANRCRYDFTSVLDLFPPDERFNFVGRAVVKLNADNELYGDYVYAQNRIKFASSETPVNDFSGNGPFLYPVDGPFYPTSVVFNGQTLHPTGPITISGWRAKPAGRRTDEPDTIAQRGTVGAKGTLLGWDYDTALNWTQSKATDKYIDGWLSEKRLRAAIATGKIDVFSGNPLSAEGQALLDAAKVLEDVRRSKSEIASWDLTVSKELLQLPAGPLASAFGAEFRREKLADNPLPILASGDLQGGGGALPPVDGSRHVKALFVEFNVPIMKNVEAQVAGRYDDYSDFGTTFNPKVALRWQPTKQVLLRGSYNTGYHAPTLPNLLTQHFQGNTADSFDDPERCAGGKPRGSYVNEGLECDAQFNNLQGGNRSLQAEKSKQWTAGFLIEPTRYTAIGIDYWDVKLRNQINFLGDTTLFGNYAKYRDSKFVRYARNPATGACVNDDPANPTPANVPCAINFVVQTLDNLGEVNTTGFDLSFNAALPTTNFGRFRLQVNGTYTSKFDYQKEKDGEFFHNAGNFTSDNGAIPRWRHYATAGWTMGPWDASISQTFVKGYRDDPAGGDRDVGNWEIYDVQATWSGIKNLHVTLGVKNVFDRDPPTSVQGQTFQVGYDPVQADPHGRMFFGVLNYTFK